MRYDHEGLVSRSTRIMNKYKEYKGAAPRKERRLLGITIMDYFPSITKIPYGLSILRTKVGWCLSYNRPGRYRQQDRNWSINLLKLTGKWKLTKTDGPEWPFWMHMWASAPTQVSYYEPDSILTREQAAQMIAEANAATFEYDVKKEYAFDRIQINPCPDTVDIDGVPFKKKK